MTDFENSDDELYANESFENESDTEVPEMSEFESETSENSEDNDEDDDDDDLPSVKLNTGPIKRNSFSNNFTTIHKTDVVPFASSSDEEDDVIVGQTLAEINTPSMHFEDEPPTPVPRHLLPIFKEKAHHLKSVDEETQASSEEISEEEDDEEEEFKRIQDMEEKYLQQNSAKSLREINSERIKGSVLEKDGNGEKEQGSDEQETESDDEAEEEQESNYELETATATKDEHLEASYSDNNPEIIYSSEPQNNIPDNTIESMTQNSLMQIIQSSLTNLKIPSANNNKDYFLNTSQALLLSETVTQSIDTTNIINPEHIAMAVVNALKSTGMTNLHSLGELETQNQELIKEHQKTEDKEDRSKLAIEPNTESGEERAIEMVQYKDGYEGEEEIAVEVEEIQNNDHVADVVEDNYDDDRDVYYDAHFDYRITSKTPTSFNSDDYIFHANFIKQFHRTNSTDKLRVKPHPRKSMSFSNERMREIERHNQILLRKILAKKPTYTLKSKPSQTSVQKIPSQTNARLTTSAVNRKKQQRQIDLDNQVLKRKIEAISLRRRPLIP